VIAEEVRCQWELSATEPVKKMVALLERHRAIAARVSFESERMDALSVLYKDRTPCGPLRRQGQEGPVEVRCGPRARQSRHAWLR
jgi:hypothetical protein